MTTSGIRDFLSAVFLGIAFVQSAVYVANGNLTLGLLVTCISLVPRFHQGIVNLIGANLSFKKQIGKYDELLSYLDLDTEAEGDKTAPRFLENALEFVSVSYQYDDRQQVLKDFSFSLRAHARWRGNQNYELQWYRNQIAYVPQELFLFSGTIRENIEWIAGSVSEQSMQEALEGCCIADLIAKHAIGIGHPYRRQWRRHIRRRKATDRGGNCRDAWKPPHSGRSDIEHGSSQRRSDTGISPQKVNAGELTTCLFHTERHFIKMSMRVCTYNMRRMV